MALKHAKVLDESQYARLMRALSTHSEDVAVDKAVLALSYKAGLRVQEIAGLEWDRHILDVDGNIQKMPFDIPVPGSKKMQRQLFPTLYISSDIGKYGSERTLCMHNDVYKALQALLETRTEEQFVIPNRRKASQDLKKRAVALRVRINRLYEAMGLEGCTSHSGRRTFVTTAARKAYFAGASLKDVQVMAGHKQLSTTEAYIEVSATQASLIQLL